MPRFNFTGRRRISQKDVLIRVSGIGGIESFTVHLELDRYRFPDDARIVLEAWRHLELKRFELGTVARFRLPEDRRLSEFGTAEGVRFRLKIVATDAPAGRLLGVADRIVPSDPRRETMPRIPLLSVRSLDLGREIWRLDFTDEPILLINQRLACRKSLVQSSEFQSLVLPEVLRSVLTRIAFTGPLHTFQGRDDWRGRWIHFALSLPGVATIPIGSNPHQDLDWIDFTVGSFCRWRGVDQQFEGYWQKSNPSNEQGCLSESLQTAPEPQESTCWPGN